MSAPEAISAVDFDLGPAAKSDCHLLAKFANKLVIWLIWLSQEPWRTKSLSDRRHAAKR